MQFLPVLVLAAVATVQTSPSLKRSDAVLVRAVIDGNSIEVATVGRVRLLGIDAPALAPGLESLEPIARRARERLTSLVLNRWVRLELESPLFDASRRRPVYVVREDGVFVNAVLLREGLARLSAHRPLARLQELQRAEQEAQSFHSGLWGQAPTVASKARDRYTEKSETSPKPRRSRPRRSR